MNRPPFPPTAGGGHRPDRPEDPADWDDLEARVRGTLTHRADSIVPGDRWLHIQVGTTDTTRRRSLRSLAPTSAAGPARAGMPRWLLPVAASLVTLLVGAGVWVAFRPRVTDPALTSAGTTIIESMPTDALSRGLQTLATTSWSAPVYYVQMQPDSSWALQRDFVPAQLTDASGSARATLALTTIVAGRLPSGEPMPPYLGIQSPWQPDTSVTATVTATQIDVVLSRPGRTGLDSDQQRVAVQSLVWTATAAAQQNVPVRVSAAGDTAVFPTRLVGTYQRPAAAYQDLAPIWITDALRYIVVVSTRPIIIDGQAAVVDGALRWELRRADGTLVKSGTSTATSARPARGTWRIQLGMLGPGDYRLRVYSTSAKDGTVDAETESPFTVS